MTIGGRNLFLESGPKDQRPLESREDIIVFTSDTLTEDIEVTGQIKAFLNFSTDSKDTDLVVRLCDVYPDEKSILIADGTSRLTCKEDLLHQPQMIEVDLWSTSIVFTKGHKIRVSVSSSNYPRFEINLTELAAKNSLHVGGDKPSHILLPIVRKGDMWLTADK